MASIQEYLDLIKNAIYGKDVRQAIHDGIQQCYLDASGPHFNALDHDVNNLKSKKVNQPLDRNNQPINGTSGQSLRTKGDGTTEWADVGLPTDEQTAQAVSEWLDGHPEATTTVQDGSLTLNKFKPKEMPFVTPEMYGAKGDGIVDDTEAWQNAVDSGINVKATSRAYKCGIINVSKNIEIDCNGAEFVCTDIKLFNCFGEVVDSIENESDYIANKVYSISTPEYSSYTGFAMMRGDNNFEKSRSYYKGGFACEFYNGKLITPYPVDAENPIIDIIKPISVKIKHVGDISYIDSQTEHYSISILYGMGCVIEDSIIGCENVYTCINIEKSLYCTVSNCNIVSDFISSITQTYLVALLDSSFCTVKNSYMFNQHWHCITTGGNYLCYRNVIDDCKLMCNDQYAFCDHENAVNSVVINSICAGIIVSGGGHIENCTVVPRKDNVYKACNIRLSPVSNVENAIYIVRDVRLYTDPDSTWSNVGVEFYHSPQETGGTYYYKSCIFENVKKYGVNLGQFSFSLPTTSSYEIREVLIDNTNLNIFIGKQTTNTSLDISKYKLFIRNISERKTALNYALLGNTGYTFNDVDVVDSLLGSIKGTFHDLTFSNLFIASTMSSSDFSVTNYLGGHQLKSRFEKALLESPTYLNISDMRYNDSNTYLNIYKNNVDNKAYAQKWSNGSMTTVEIPN